MSSGAVRCQYCGKTVFQSNIWLHVNTFHGSWKSRSVIEGGVTMDWRAFVNSFPGCRYEPGPDDVVVKPPVGPTDIVYELGMSKDTIDNVGSSNVSGVGKVSVEEMRRMFNALNEFGGTGFRLNRSVFFVSLAEFLVLGDGSSEVDGKGTVVLQAEPRAGETALSQGAESVEVSWASVLAKWCAALEDTQRVPTFRKVARSLGPAIYRAVNANATLGQYKTLGTPLSARYGIPPKHFLVALSFWPSMKPQSEWSKDEAAYWESRKMQVVVEKAAGPAGSNKPMIGEEEDVDGANVRKFAAAANADVLKQREKFAAHMAAEARKKPGLFQSAGFGDYLSH